MHRLFLQRTGIRRHNAEGRHEFVPACQAERPGKRRPLDSHNPEHAVLLEIAQDAAWILAQHGLSSGPNCIHQRYLELMLALGYASPNGHVRISRFRRDFLACYSPNLLQLLQSEVSASGDPRWLPRMVRKPRGIQSPVRHLLLMRFLGVEPALFFKPDPQSSLLGVSPFPCLNRVCGFYKQPVIDTYELKHTSEHGPVGRFSCPHCGSVYERWNSDPLIADNVVDYGREWHEKLAVAWRDESISLRNLSQQLGVWPKTTKRHAAKLGLPFPRRACGRTSRFSNPRRTDAEIKLTQARQSRRSVWETELAANPNLTRSELRRRQPAIYSWLYRYDKAWLDSHQPTRQKRHPSLRRVNWNERDAGIADLILKVATDLKSSSGGSKRLSVNALGHLSGTYSTIIKHLDKLPLTQVALAKVVESPEQFAVRRINSVRDRLLAQQELHTRSRLMYQAGIGDKYIKSHTVQAAIEDALRTLREKVAVPAIPQPSHVTT